MMNESENWLENVLNQGGDDLFHLILFHLDYFIFKILNLHLVNKTLLNSYLLTPSSVFLLVCRLLNAPHVDVRIHTIFSPQRVGVCLCLWWDNLLTVSLNLYILQFSDGLFKKRLYSFSVAVENLS